MIEFLTSWGGVITVLSVLVTIVLGALLADANGRADRWQEWAEDLEAENDELRHRLRRRGERVPIVALPPRQGMETGR